MPSRKLRSLLRIVVTPRFEIFYALRALGNTSGHATAWRSRTAGELSSTLLRAIRSLSPRPVMWALLADSLRDAAPDPDFDQLLDTITSLDNPAFQRAILGGVFH